MVAQSFPRSHFWSDSSRTLVGIAVATITLIAFELLTWSIQGQTELWAVRILGIVFEICLAGVLVRFLWIGKSIFRRSASGEITHFIAVKQDVTEKKKLESQYRHAQKMEGVGRLAGGMRSISITS